MPTTNLTQRFVPMTSLVINTPINTELVLEFIFESDDTSLVDNCGQTVISLCDKSGILKTEITEVSLEWTRSCSIINFIDQELIENPNDTTEYISVKCTIPFTNLAYRNDFRLFGELGIDGTILIGRGVIYVSDLNQVLSMPNYSGLEIMSETPLGLMNGINMNFTTEFDFNSVTLEVFLNGLSQVEDTDFIITGSNSFSLIEPPGSDENVTVSYTRS